MRQERVHDAFRAGSADSGYLCTVRARLLFAPSAFSFLSFSRRVPYRPAVVLATAAAPSATFFCFRVASCPFATLLFSPAASMCGPLRVHSSLAPAGYFELPRPHARARNECPPLRLGSSALPCPLSVDLFHSTRRSSFKNRRCVPIQAHNGLLSFRRRQHVVSSREWIWWPR